MWHKMQLENIIHKIPSTYYRMTALNYLQRMATAKQTAAVLANTETIAIVLTARATAVVAVHASQTWPAAPWSACH